MGGLLPAMKYETYSEYDPRHTALAESAFLTLWSTLGSWHADLVLVGGLVPKYLCGDLTQHRSLPRPATLDVDLGIAPGVDRALATARTIEVSGVDLHGADQKLTARVCEVGPFLALKLRAFCDRQQPKDAFDILYTLRHYDGGSAAAFAAFAGEVRVGNPACTDALRTLQEHFQTESLPGPVKASHFVLGQAQSGESEDTRFLRTTLRQDMVDAAAQLLKAAKE
jgi:hypothetical protein